MRDKFSNGYILRGLAFTLLVIGLIILTLPRGPDLAKSFGLGAVISMAFFKQTYLVLNRALDMEGGKATGFTLVHYLIRYAIYGLVLYAGAQRPDMSLLAVFFGLLTMKIVIHISNFKDYFTSARKEVKHADRDLHPLGKPGDLDS